MKNKKILLANSLLLLALFLFISVPIIASRLFGLQAPISGNISLLLSGGTSVIALGGIALLYCRITKRRFFKVMVIKKITMKQLILTMLVSVGTYIFAVGVNSISMKLFPIVIEDGMAISKLLNNSSILLGFFVVILVPAFFEEVFFRGIFLDAYEGMNKRLKFFVITVIFATFHGNIMQIIYVLFLGIILLKVREYTGSLLGSMTLHATNNAISFILSKVAMSYMNLMSNGIDNTAIDPAKAAASVSFSITFLRASIFFLIGGAILFINLRKLKEYKAEKEGLEFNEKEKEKFSQAVEYNEEENYMAKNEKIMITDIKQYIPLILYIISITILVIRRY